MNSPSAHASRIVNSDWLIVIATFGGFLFTAIMTATLSMFIEPVGGEFGWSRTLLSFGFMLSTMVTALISPFFGAVVDRFGSRRIALPGIILTTGAMAAFSLIGASPAHWIMAWAFYALIAISVSPTVWTAAIASIFKRGQGLALGITLCGAAVAQIVLPPLTNWLIEEYGWRFAYVAIAVGFGGITFLLSWLFLADAHSRIAATRTANADPAARIDFPGLTLRQAWRSRALWFIAISTIVTMMLAVGLTVHQMPILGDAGISRMDAALLVSMAGGAAIAGKIVTGVLLDRYRPNWVGGLTLGASALAFALLIDGVHTPALIVFAMLVNGYTQGTKLQICAILVVRYAGMKNFGKIYGFMNSVVSLGSGLGPVLAGLIFDLSGGYEAFLVIGVIVSAIAGMLIASLPAYPDWEKPTVARGGRELPA